MTLPKIAVSRLSPHSGYEEMQLAEGMGNMNIGSQGHINHGYVNQGQPAYPQQSAPLMQPLQVQVENFDACFPPKFFKIVFPKEGWRFLSYFTGVFFWRESTIFHVFSDRPSITKNNASLLSLFFIANIKFHSRMPIFRCPSPHTMWVKRSRLCRRPGLPRSATRTRLWAPQFRAAVRPFSRLPKGNRFTSIRRQTLQSWCPTRRRSVLSYFLLTFFAF